MFGVTTTTSSQPLTQAAGLGNHNATLLVLLGIGRARIAHTAVVRTVIETVGVAAAAFAGLLIGTLVNHVSGH
jgi:hypothetical protein